MSINLWMNKHILAGKYYLVIKKEWTMDTQNNLNEFQDKHI